MSARPNAPLAQIRQQIMWSRLIAVVEQQAQTMLRTAFSTPFARPAICRLACSIGTAECWRRPSPARRDT